MRNEYNSSLFEAEDGTCYLCGYEGNTARHEILHGPNRQNSKKYGCWICLCSRCHTEVHKEDNGKYLFLKEAAETLFINYRIPLTLMYQELTPEEERFILGQARKAFKEWMAIFGRNYIDGINVDEIESFRALWTD